MEILQTNFGGAISAISPQRQPWELKNSRMTQWIFAWLLEPVSNSVWSSLALFTHLKFLSQWRNFFMPLSLANALLKIATIVFPCRNSNFSNQSVYFESSLFYEISKICLSFYISGLHPPDASSTGYVYPGSFFSPPLFFWAIIMMSSWINDLFWIPTLDLPYRKFFYCNLCFKLQLMKAV